MAHTPDITVVVPVHNNAAGVRRSLGALAALVSEHEQLEVVVVDDGSTDDTASVLPDAARQFSRHKIVTTCNHGAAAARNTGAGVATGDFIVFLDANDEPLKGWLAGLARQLGPGVGIAHCEPAFSDPVIRTDYGSLLPGCFAISRELFMVLGGYDANLRFAENADLVERAHVYCASNGLEISRSGEALIVVHEVSDPRRYDGDRLDAMSYLLDRDAAALRQDRGRTERLARIGAVSAARIGQPRRARALAWTALRARPTNPRNWARVVMTAAPSLSRRRWPGTEER